MPARTYGKDGVIYTQKPVPARNNPNQIQPYPAFHPDSEPIVLHMIQYLQHDQNLFNGTASAFDIMRVTTVPRMIYSKNPSETTKVALASNLDLYQRPLDQTRKTTITTFFNTNTNFIANSALTWFPEGQVVATENDEQLQISRNKGTIRELSSDGNVSFKKIIIPVVEFGTEGNDLTLQLKRECSCPTIIAAGGDRAREVRQEGPWSPSEGQSEEWFDYCKRCGWSGRPGEIIDGQHRIRGAASSRNKNSLLPVGMVLNDYFNSTRKAKLFTEITTEAIGLDGLHQVNLAYRSNPKIITPKAAGNPRLNFTNATLANLYAAFGKLTTNGLLKDRIAIVPKELKDSKAVKVTAIIGTVHQMMKWAIESELVAAFVGKSKTDIISIIQNWFTAVSQTTWGGRPVGDLWKTTKKPNGEIQNPKATEAHFKCLTKAISKLAQIGIVGVPSVANFKLITDYIQDFDLRGTSIHMGLSGNTGQVSRTQIGLVLGAVIEDIPVAGGAFTHPRMLPPTTWSTTMPRRAIDPVTPVRISGNPLNAGNTGVAFEVEWTTPRPADAFTRSNTKFPMNAKGFKSQIILKKPLTDDWVLPTLGGNPYKIEEDKTNPNYSVGDTVDVYVRFEHLVQGMPSRDTLLGSIVL